MIKSVQLINFEGHKDTFLEFSDGMNILSGSSGAGKSSIRRAIMWVILNHLSSKQVVSWWCYNDKGKQKDTCSVTVTLADGTRISRIKSPELNGYQINDDKPLEAVGITVPPEVTALLMFKDVNLQTQLEPHFLVASSSGEVARYLNEVVDLTEADRYQSEIESKRRKCNTDLDTAIKSATQAEVELAKFNWLPAANDLIASIEVQQTAIASTQTLVDAIEKQITTHETIQEKLDNLEFLPKAIVAIKKIKDSVVSHDTIDAIRSKIATWEGIVKGLASCECIPDAERCIKRIARMKEGIPTVDPLRKAIASYEDICERIASTKAELQVAETEFNLIQLCPTCGARLHDTKVVF